MKKLLSFILCAVILIGVVPFAHKAEAAYKEVEDVIYSFDFDKDAIVEGWEVGGKQGGSLPPWWQTYDISSPSDETPQTAMASESYKWNDNGHVRTDAFLYSPWIEVPGKYGTSKAKFDEWNADYADELYVGYQVEGDSTISWIKKVGVYYELSNWQHIKCEIPAAESQKLAGKNIRFVIRHLYDIKLNNGAAVYIDNFEYTYINTYNSIERVNISGWGDPTPNGTPAALSDLETEDSSYYVQYIKWYRENGGSFTKFEPGNTYWAEICVIPTDESNVFSYTGKKGLDQFSEGVFLNEDTDFIDYEKSSVFLPDKRESHARLLIVTEKGNRKVNI